ncbi:DUF4176 domain-containing protein [Lacrimispora sp.]|uniref:DUF4176 domain-containing protein n=1 Tax=Lacrimispora sp. TaxID=2719234 RepID=UPI00289B8485|nr:DUF4176 domain-containing protein [Lacrimispora sp.]
MANLLPLGSIVVLKNGEKKIMIYGRKQIEAKTQKLFDYVACLYPEGNINEEYCYLFNNSDIREIIFRGYSDVDEVAYLSYLEALTEQAGNPEN